MIAQEIYDITMALMDEMKNDGTVDINSTKDYLARTPGILTILQNEIQLKFGLESLDRIETMQDDVDLDDIICNAILPYGLASRLLGQEDPTLSNYFSSLYSSKLEESATRFKNKAQIIKRTDVYNCSMRVGD